MLNDDSPAGELERSAIEHFNAARYDDALQCFESSLRQEADIARTWHNIGLTLSRLGRTTEARRAFEATIQKAPNHAEAHFNLARTLKVLGALDEAEASYRKVVAIEPQHLRAWNNLGNLLHHVGRLNEAITAYNECLRITEYGEARFNLANTLRELGDLIGAERQYKLSLAASPALSSAAINLASLYGEQANLRDAALYFDAVLSREPENSKALSGYGSALHRAGRANEAEHNFRRALCLSPNDAQTRSNLCLCLNYDPSLTQEQILEEHKRYAAIHSAVPQCSQKMHVRGCRDHIRIGYVSPDFRQHAVSYFSRGLLRHHDRSRFRVYCYSDVTVQDDVTESIRRTSDTFHDVARLTHDRLAEKIRGDGIDILVDLAGHTAHNRLPLFAMRPAPTSVTYIGYPNTTGLSDIDYRVVDSLTDPPGSEHQSVERLLRLSPCFLAYTAPDDAPAVADAARSQNGFVSFGVFAHDAKINGDTVRLWNRLLQQVAGSRLVLKTPGTRTASGRELLLDRLRCQGLNSERVFVLPYLPTIHEHLNSYAEIDVVLDTFPYNGTTTTCEALLMGVPVVTLVGERHASRVGLSLLSAAGFSSWCCSTPDEYIARAEALGRDSLSATSRRREIRRTFLDSPLCRADELTKEFERELIAALERNA